MVVGPLEAFDMVTRVEGDEVKNQVKVPRRTLKSDTRPKLDDVQRG
jgi:hypothetical protein